MLSEENMYRSKKLDIEPKICSHLAVQKREVPFQRAMIYLKLIGDGCDRQRSLAFASKMVCMSDRTAKMEGPHPFRIKVKQDKKAVQIKGSINTERQYDMGHEFRNGIHDILKENQQLEEAFNTKVLQNVEMTKFEYYHKLKRFRQFLRDEDQKNCLDLKKIKQNAVLLEKLRSFRRDLHLSPKNPEGGSKSPSKKPARLIDYACRSLI